MPAPVKWAAAVFVLLLWVGAGLAAHTWYAKPLRFSWFLDRVLLQHTLDDPELLTSLRLLEPLGIDGHNGRLTDLSVEHAEQMAVQWQRDRDTLHAYDRNALSAAEQLAYDVMDDFVGGMVQGRPWMFHDYPVNPLAGVQSELPTLMATQQQVETPHEAEQYLQRLEAYGDKFQQLLQGLRLREERGIIPPAFVVQKSLQQMRAFVATPAQQNLLYVALADKLAASGRFDDEQRSRVLMRAEERIESDVYPAYDRLIAYFERLQLKAQRNDGVWALPDGDAYYAYQVRRNTTTDLTPEELHQLGVAEVARIESEMDAILRQQGYVDGSVGARMAALGTEPRFLYDDTEAGRAAVLADFQKIINEAIAAAPLAFNRVPASRVEVRRVPEFKQASSPGAYYDPAPLDGSRPGTFWVNLRDMRQIKRFAMRTLAYHEAVPGHHFQIAIARELDDVSTVQRVLPFTAYVEGWALYAEQLAQQIGLESDPFDNLGRLRDEQFRAVRLVVDTGLHHRRWTREQAIAYMIDKTGMSDGDVVAEVERYLIDPGQALAYKTGMLKILELRRRAESVLGDRFDLKAFHDQVLDAGALPLGVLEARIDRWIEAGRAPR